MNLSQKEGILCRHPRSRHHLLSEEETENQRLYLGISEMKWPAFHYLYFYKWNLQPCHPLIMGKYGTIVIAAAYWVYEAQYYINVASCFQVYVASRDHCCSFMHIAPYHQCRSLLPVHVPPYHKCYQLCYQYCSSHSNIYSAISSILFIAIEFT